MAVLYVLKLLINTKWPVQCAYGGVLRRALVFKILIVFLFQ